MSKADNIKRAKLLRKNKREREKQVTLNHQLENNKQKLIHNAHNEGSIVVDRAIFGAEEKISSLVLEMIFPYLKVAKDEKVVRSIVSLGIAAWNGGVLEQLGNTKELDEVLKNFRGHEDPVLSELLEEFMTIKCTKYKQYLDFIISHELSIEEDGRTLNLTVMTDLTEGLLNNHFDSKT